ncbi:MAG TPA: NUDIX domain-containing protein [Bacteriovoracaceae bacterium]|nr:NUDIX domain-containing protein [Bacteriovoracaceae bacterium]
MRIIPVALCVFYEKAETLRVWVQTRTDDGPYHGLLEFPGGGIESGETPLLACVREVEEEVGIKINSEDHHFFGNYTRDLGEKKILLYIYLFPKYKELDGLGQWLEVGGEFLSSPFSGKIPPLNHQIIDDLYKTLYSGPHE